jgi:hypothetical protein
MERSGRTAAGGLHPTDLADLTRRPGPFLTVWAACPTPVQGDVATVVNSVVNAASGADRLSSEVLHALAEAITGVFPDAAGVVAIADDSGVQLVEPLPQAPRAEIARLHELPALAPVLEHRQGTIPFVLVVTDRQGADLFWSGTDNDGETHVEGGDGPIRKVHAGGWSQERFQRRAENTWEQTAAEVATSLARVAERVQPRVVTVAGDVRMVQLLRQHLPAELGRLVRDVPGGRSEDGSDDARADAIRRWVRTAVAEDTVAILQLFEQERGQNDRAADGPAATLAALREARVDVLLVHDDSNDTRIAYFLDDDPTQVSEDLDMLASLNLGRPRQGRLVDVAIRAALATGAGVRVVPNAGPVSDGVGAILRW